MANPYKDANGHWTTKENDGGPCRHTDGKHQTKIENGSYYLRTSEDAPWEEVSYEEFNEVRQGGYSPFDEADDKLDFGFDEDEAADKQDNYATIAAEMTKDGVDINDKDAVLEQLYKKYNFSDDEIRDYMKNVYGDSMEEPKPQANDADIEKRKRELSNEYWGLAEDYQMEQRMNDDEWNARGFPDFEKKYGTEEEFIEKGLNKDKIDLNDRKTREDLTRVSENLDENKLKRMNQERNDRIENARDKWNDFVEQKNDTDRYSQPAYGDEEGHDYELDALRERDEKGLNNDFGPEPGDEKPETEESRNEWDEDTKRREISNKYRQSAEKWEKSGFDGFEELHGTEEEFTEKILNANFEDEDKVIEDVRNIASELGIDTDGSKTLDLGFRVPAEKISFYIKGGYLDSMEDGGKLAKKLREKGYKPTYDSRAHSVVLNAKPAIRVMKGAQSKKESERSPEPKTTGEKSKLDYIKEYFDVWGKPGQSQFDEVVKFYGLNKEEADDLKKYFKYGEN